MAIRNHDSKPETIVELLGGRANQQPDRVAYTFLADGEIEGSGLTFAELDLRARAIGSWLRSTSTTGERALLLCPPGLEFVSAFFGCLYAGMIAVPAYPLDPNRLQRTASRLRAIVQDSRPVTALTTCSSLPLIDQLVQEHADLRSMRWAAVESIPSALAADWRRPAIDSDTVAILQYTSGSIAAPKGVLVSHSNVLENERMIQEAHGYSNTSTFVGWIPLAHDWGLINNVLQALYVGAGSILMSPEAFLEKPSRWLRAISRYRNVTSGGPGFAYELCASKVTAAERTELDLRNWTWAGIGASPVLPATIERFAEVFAGCGFRREAFYAGYGLAEATLLVCDSDRIQAPRVLPLEKTSLERNKVVVNPPEDVAVTRLVSCGAPPSGEKIAIVDPETGAECSPGHVGEIWVSGGNVAQGYWNNPIETDGVFRARLRDTQEGPFLRTGDLGFLDHGELFVTGRLKDLIIIRGRNLYPQDIESSVEKCHKALRPGCTVAFSIQAHNDERLVVIQEVRASAPASSAEIISAIREAVFREHEIVAYGVVLVRERSIPKTSSGKLRRQACRIAFLDGKLDLIERNVLEEVRLEDRTSLNFIAPRTLAEKKLARIWSEILRVEKVGIHDRFFDVGGDSLTAAQCLVQITAEFGLKQAPLETFLCAATLAQMAEAVSDPALLTKPAAGGEGAALPLQPNGSRVPFFCFPGADENPYYFLDLARSLGRDQPFYAVRDPMPMGERGAYTVEEVADRVIAVIHSVQRDGPYIVGGHCYGGIVAFEVARQLIARGEDVGMLVLFEVPAPGYPKVLRHWRKYCRQAVEILRGERQVTIREARSHLRILMTLFRRKATVLNWRLLMWAGLKRVVEPLPACDHLVIHLNRQSGRSYNPRALTCNVIQFIAAGERHSTLILDDPRLGWREFSQAEFTVCKTPGRADEIFKQPHVQELAAQLRALLDRVNAPLAVRS